MDIADSTTQQSTYPDGDSQHHDQDHHDPHAHHHDHDETVEHVPNDDAHLSEITDHESQKHVDQHDQHDQHDQQHEHQHLVHEEGAVDDGNVEHIAHTTQHDDAHEEIVEHHHEEVDHEPEHDMHHEEHGTEHAHVHVEHPHDADVLHPEKEESVEQQPVQDEHAVASAPDQSHLAPAADQTPTAVAATAAIVGESPRGEEDAAYVNVNGSTDKEVRQRRKSHERYHASAEQLKHLIAAFEQDPTPSAMTLNLLCSTTGMPMHNMVLWFKNRRARHKKANPSPAVSKPGKRSYVKSGIYSRGPKSKHDEINASLDAAAAAATAVTAVTVGVHPPAPDLSHSVVMEAVDAHIAHAADIPAVHDEVVVKTDYSDETGVKRALENDDETLNGPVKRQRFQGVKEVIGSENPCHEWDGNECLLRCLSFFYKSIGSAHERQMSVATTVSKAFFLGEMQNGLTLTSAMQPLETGVEVLDGIMEATSTEGIRLSSGSKVIMREFLAQLRSGMAAGVEVMEVPGIGGEEENGNDVAAAE